tara:strand:- start:228 stop:479 length:252 start_codon:yes stop_codon:yes gene_type:complete
MGQLGDFTLDQVAGALALVLGSVGGLCLIMFKSRCEKISLCWGLWVCDRKVPEVDPEDPKEPEPQPEPEPEPEPEPIVPNNNP